jgi:phosphatidylinositol alpha-1,6-mannosyltransferase
MRPMAHPVRIFLMGSEFFRRPGGIQRVNCLLLEMLAEFAAATPTEVEIFSFADEGGGKPADMAAFPAFRWQAFDHSRWAMAAQLGRRLREVRPDLLLFTHAHLLRLVRLTRLLRLGAKVAVLGHGVEVWKELPQPIRGWMQSAHAAVAPSAFTRNKMVEMNGVSPGRISILHHGLDALWQANGQPGGPLTGKRLLTVTRLGLADTYKGVDVALRALPAVLQRHPTASYVIAGDGNDRPRLEKLAGELGIETHVEFCGEVSGSKLHSLYAGADVFVLPSQKEGFGIVFLEAMSYGLPVVAARAAGTLDVVQDGATGLLVTPEQPGALAEALNGLLADASRRRALGEAGRRRVEEHFLFEHFSRRWQRWLVELLPEAVYLARQAAAFARAIPEAQALKLSAV